MARIDQQVARMIYRSQQQEATVALIEQLDLCDGQHLPLKGSSLPGNIVNSEQIETADQVGCHMAGNAASVLHLYDAIREALTSGVLIVIQHRHFQF